MVSRLLYKQTLITGATGFIGANLVSSVIDQGLVPHIMIRQNSNLWRIKELLNRVKIHYADLTDQDSIEKLVRQIKPKIIYHCATYGGYSFQTEKDKIITANIIGTINLLNACSKVGFDCFINSGSSSEYGIKKQSMKESDLLEPITNYGAAKASVTLFCQALAKRERLPIATLRLFSPYGYYEDKKRLIPSVILSCLNKQNPTLSSPDSVRDFIFIEDVLDVYIKTAEKIDNLRGRILNIGSGIQHSVSEVVDKIISLTDNGVKPLWKILSNPRTEPTSWVADISQAEQLLGFRPNYSLEQGLTKAIKWFKEHISYYDRD